MVRRIPTVAQFFSQIQAIRAHRDGPDREELLSMWKMLGAMVSMFEVIILNSPALAEHDYVNHVLRELVDVHKDMVGDTPGADDDDEPPTKRRRLGDEDNGDASASGPSTSPPTGPSTSPHRLDDDVINDSSEAGSSAGPSTGQTTTRKPDHSLDSDSDLEQLL